MIRHFFRLGISALLLLCALCTEAQVQFEEVAEQLGLEHMHRSQFRLGGGVAIFDYDNDGWEDLYLTGGLDPDKLYRNVNGTSFQDVSAQSGISSISSIGSFGVVSGDVDNDGFRDILVTTQAGYESRLMRNQGNGTFQLLPNAFNDGEGWKSACSFGDVNKDGFLDIYIGAYIDNSSVIMEDGEVVGFDHECGANYLFLNNGDLTFTDVSDLMGLADPGCALAVAFTDFDNDLDLDLMVANDFGAWVHPSGLFQNEHPTSQYTDISQLAGLDFQIYGMGIAIGDYDRDGDLDYYQTNLGRNVLSRNDEGVFSDVTTFANCENDSTGQLLHTSWGSFFFDADNDAWPDLFIANGEIPAADIILNVLLDPNKLYLNNTDGTFTDVSIASGVASTLRGRGAAYADFDKDGKLDFVVQNIHNISDSTNFELYHNVSQTGNWLAFKLQGVQSNRDAFGSHVRLVLNGVSTLAEIDGGSSHASQNSSVAHFGLGSASMADSVVITFPSGIQHVLTNVSANQQISVIEDIPTHISNTSSETAQFIIIRANASWQILSPKEEIVVIELFDVSGRQLESTRMMLIRGFNTWKPRSIPSTGVFVVRIVGNGGSQSFKLIQAD